TLAWAKYPALAVFTPTIKSMNPATWQRSFTDDDKLFLQMLYCHTVTPSHPCHIYNNPSRSKPNYTETYRNVKNCPDLVISKTTVRVHEVFRQHFGATVQFRCIDDFSSMFGDETRTCLRNGEWSGEQPFCIPRELIQYFCSYASSDKKCRRIKFEKDETKLQKRSISENSLLPYKSVYKIQKMKAMSDFICIGFTYLIQPKSEVEVYAKRNGKWMQIWNGFSTETYTSNRVEIELKVIPGEVFAIRLVAKYADGISQQFLLKYMHIFANSCNVK
ncbi:hypothetical protein B4U80_12353, partial [Leptotrombidium deliense]